MPDNRQDCGHSTPSRSNGGRVGKEATTRTRAAYTLLVRLWKEPRCEPDAAVWRGMVTDLRGRRLGSFSSAAELAEIVGEMTKLDVLLRVSRAEPGRAGTTHDSDTTM
jgi:hypothetical protein